MIPETFKWGIIGTGNTADEFVNDLRLATNARHKVRAVFSYEAEKAKEFARETGAVDYFDNIEEFLIKANIDVAYVATPHPQHHRETLLCLENQIPVLCEKPLGMNAMQVETMIEKSQAQNCFLMEAMRTRFLPSILKVLELIEEDAIGEIKFIKANKSFKAPRDPENKYFDPFKGAGSLLDLGIYPLFLIILLLGIPNEIKAGASLNDKNIDESCVAILTYENGSYAFAESSLVEKTDLTATIYGSKGSIKILSPWSENPSAIILENHKGILERFRCRWRGSGFQFEIEEVSECIKQGKIESEFYPHEFSLKLARIMDEIRLQTGIIYPFD